MPANVHTHPLHEGCGGGCSDFRRTLIPQIAQILPSADDCHPEIGIFISSLQYLNIDYRFPCLFIYLPVKLKENFLEAGFGLLVTGARLLI